MIYALSLFALFSGAAASPFTETDYLTAFRSWTQQHNKNYQVSEFFERYATFKDNMDFVEAHNTGGYSYRTHLNQYADMTNKEFRNVMHGFTPKFQDSENVHQITSNIPSTVDWTTKGAVTPIKNQGQCGSCWAFSTTGSMEGSYFLKHGTLKSFSEQQLVDCSAKYGNQGCQGGLMDNAFKYIEANGICTEQDYPYKGVTGTCKASSCTPAAKVATYTDVPSKNLDALASAVAQQPVSVAVDAAGLGWQLYHSGIYSGGMLGACGTSLDHGVLVVGYGEGYWKVKNSWGASWGENGYIQLKRSSDSTGAGTCGLALQPSYPTVA